MGPLLRLKLILSLKQLLFMCLRIGRLCGFVVTVVGIIITEAAHALLLECSAHGMRVWLRVPHGTHLYNLAFLRNPVAAQHLPECNSDICMVNVAVSQQAEAKQELCSGCCC